MACYLLPSGIRFNDYLFTDPVPLAQWRPSACAGVVVVLARNSQWAPKPLQPLFFSEFGNNTAGGTIAAALHSGARADDLLISAMPMPFSSVAQRRAVCKELIAAYNPAWQSSGMVVSTTQLAHQVEELEARQQEQSQQILSLLAYIGKLFEPPPVVPRRPIGFLAPLRPAEAGATESGS